MTKNEYTYHVKITGMTCSSCVNTIKSCLKADYKADIKEIDIDLVNEEAWIVGNKKGLGPTFIDAIKNLGFGASMIVPPDRDTFAYYFQVKDNAKTNKSNSERSDMLKLHWMGNKIVKEVNVNFSSNRARVVVSAKVDPLRFVSTAKFAQCKAKLLGVKNQKTLYFAIRGLTSSQDAVAISDVLETRKEYIISHNVSYSTSTISIHTHVPEDAHKQAIFIDHIKRDIETVLSGKAITCKLIETPAIPENNRDLPKQYFRKAIINALLGVPLILLGGFIPLPLTVTGQLVGFLIGGATLGVMWKTGKDFYQKAWSSLIHRRSSDMNTLIALGTGSAWLYSMLLVIAPMSFPLIALQYQFLAVLMILGIINFGKGIRAIAQVQAQKGIQNVARVFTELQPPVANRLKFTCNTKVFENKNLDLDEYLEVINYRKVKKGDIIKVEPHQRVPVDGVIVHGQTFVNQETLTGESRDCNKKLGDDVFSGSLNTKNPIYIRASCKGSEGRLTTIIEEVARSTSKSSSISKVVDKVAKFIVPATIVLAIVSMSGWYFFGPAPVLPWMINAGLSVLLAICPCAFGFAAPMPMTLGQNEAEKRGILFKKPSALEKAYKVEKWMTDKTGTLTELQFSKEEMLISDEQKELGWNTNNVLDYVVSLENAYLKQVGDHPIARTYVKGSAKPSLLCGEVKKSDQGIAGIVNEKQVIVGSISYLESRKILVPKHYKTREEANARKGMTTNYVAINDKCVCVIGLKHDIRQDAKKMVADLQARGATVVMLTGDKREPAVEIAKKLGIKTVFAEKNEKQKEQHIKALRKSGQMIGMIGDGLNDSLALKAAHVGIAAGPWTHAAPSADITMQKLNLGEMCIISEQTMKNVRQNLWWTAAYNFVSVVAATGILYAYLGFVLNPSIASAMMALSSIFVVFNSSRLVYDIEHALKRFHGQIARPKSFYQKLKQFFSLDSFVRTFRMIISYYDESAEEGIRIAPSRRAGMVPIPQTVGTLANAANQSYFPSSPNRSPQKSSVGNKTSPINIKPEKDNDVIDTGPKRVIKPRRLFTD